MLTLAAVFDSSSSKRIFLLGPSHHKYSSGVLLPHPSIEGFRTPLASETIPYDKDTITSIYNANPNIFMHMSGATEEKEHSLEMHLPYIHRLLQKKYGDDVSSYPKLVPIMVGATAPNTERTAGEVLAPYFADPEAAVVVSSDFCHWGARFSYTFYTTAVPDTTPSLPLSAESLPQPDKVTVFDIHSTVADIENSGTMLQSERKYNPPPYIHESISAVDIACMTALTLPCSTSTFEDGDMSQPVNVFYHAMQQTEGNTICGRHPIAVVLNAISHIVGGNEGGADEHRGRFRFLRYERSSDVFDLSDSSVSYVSAVATL